MRTATVQIELESRVKRFNWNLDEPNKHCE
ncbi:MAG: hypothetical protein ACI82A_004185 [Candidatus Azotimanducaceae bacterium]|jgi:hypothetical protein